MAKKAIKKTASKKAAKAAAGKKTVAAAGDSTASYRANFLKRSR